MVSKHKVMFPFSCTLLQVVVLEVGLVIEIGDERVTEGGWGWVGVGFGGWGWVGLSGVTLGGVGLGGVRLGGVRLGGVGLGGVIRLGEIRLGKGGWWCLEAAPHVL